MLYFEITDGDRLIFYEEGAETKKIGLPRLAEAGDAKDTLAVLADAALYRACCNAFVKFLFGMKEDERQNFDRWRVALEVARLGLSAAQAVQEKANSRLQRLRDYGDDFATRPLSSGSSGPSLG